MAKRCSVCGKLTTAPHKVIRHHVQGDRSSMNYRGSWERTNTYCTPECEQIDIDAAQKAKDKEAEFRAAGEKIEARQRSGEISREQARDEMDAAWNRFNGIND